MTTKCVKINDYMEIYIEPHFSGYRIKKILFCVGHMMYLPADLKDISETMWQHLHLLVEQHFNGEW